MNILPEYARSKKVFVQISGIIAILLLALLNAPEWAYIAIGIPIGTHSYAQGRIDEKK